MTRGDIEIVREKEAPGRPLRSVIAVRRWLFERFDAELGWTAASFLGGLMTSFAVTGGLVLFFPGVQAALLVGLVVGMLAPNPRRAAWIATAATVVGWVLGPSSAWGMTHPWSLVHRIGGLLAAAVALAVAVAVAFFTSRYSGPRRRRFCLSCVGVGVIVANLWLTAFTVASLPSYDPRMQAVVPSFFEQLEGDVPLEFRGSDEFFFLKVRERQALGVRYYEAYTQTAASHFGSEDKLSSSVHVRMPTLFWMLHWLPSHNVWIVIWYLLLCSAAIVAVPAVSSQYVRVPLTLPAAAAVASYFLFFAVQLNILYTEPWAAAWAVIAVALLVFSRTTRYVRSAVVLSVVAATIAVLIRELMVFLPVAGFLTAVQTPGKNRRFGMLAWGASLAVFITAYVLHVLAVRPHIASGDWVTKYLSSGGVRNLWASLSYGSPLFGGKGALLVALGVLGLIGMASIADRSVRVFASWCLQLPLLGFLLVGNDAVATVGGTQVNYWGATVQPLLLAFAPTVFGWLPGLTPKPPDDGVG